MKNLYKKIITFVLIITFIFSPALAIPARAQWIDISTATKDYGLDALAWEIANRVIHRISASTVKWVNSGFKGKPAYVTDPTAYFGDLGDKVAGEFISRNPNLNFLCGDMSAKIKLALAKNYSGNDGAWRCTLTGVIDNVDDFMGDFEQGGWDGFFQLTQVQQNNPLGAYIQAEGSLFNQIASKVGEKDKELSWGSGFMSTKECVQRGAPTVKNVQEGGTFQLQDDGTSKFVGGYTRQVTEEGPCLKERTVTPGETISKKLNNVLGIGDNRLAVSDESNEIISALLNQLVNKIMGGVGGLFGASKSDSSNNNAILTDQLANDCLDQSNDPSNLDTYVATVDPNNCIHVRATVDYFGNSQDTSILDTPLPVVTTEPLDNDCRSLSPTTINSLAETSANQTGTTFEDALRNLDCDPSGIH